MTCAEARELLLVADSADLRPGAPSALGHHLSVCVDCRAAADQIVALERALRAARAVPPRRTAREAAAMAAAAGRRARARRRRILWSVGPALAAAFVVAALLVPHSAQPHSTVPVAAAPTPPPLVDGSSGDVAVITTANPDIVVVWQF
jgi:predicted anti-sigma-YlaC factor YlaD